MACGFRVQRNPALGFSYVVQRPSLSDSFSMPEVEYPNKKGPTKRTQSQTKNINADNRLRGLDKIYCGP